MLSQEIGSGTTEGTDFEPAPLRVVNGLLCKPDDEFNPLDPRQKERADSYKCLFPRVL